MEEKKASAVCEENTREIPEDNKNKTPNSDDQKKRKKKIIIFSSIGAAVALIALIIIIAVSSIHPVHKFFLKVAQTEKYEMTIEILDIPLLGSVSIRSKFDGNIQYTPATLFTDEKYVEKVGDTKYTYTKNNDGVWIKTAKADEDESSDITESEEIKELLNLDNYEKIDGEKNAYKLKDGVVFEEFKDVIFHLGDDSCTIDLTLSLAGLKCKGRIIISNVGKVDLTLPKV